MPKCLVIDDVEVTHFTVNEYLSEMGMDVTAANDIPQALSALRNSSYDVVLLDWHIGTSSGIDLLQKMRSEMNIKTPVIVFSGVENQGNAGTAVNAGANAFLEKPTTKEKLKSCMKNIGIAVSG